MNVGDGTHRGPGVAAQTLLVYDDRGREILDGVRVRLAVFGQTITDERRERLVELPLSLGSQCVEDQEDLPDPETPVKTVIPRFGILKVTSRKLFSRAPRTSMNSCRTIPLLTTDTLTSQIA